MRYLCLTLFAGLVFSSTGWQTDFEKAQQNARQEHKLILLNFSGSDWCSPCIRMHKEIFDNAVFSDFANEHLVLLNADFPRLKKNQLSKDQQLKNEKLADQYNKEGTFPLTVLLTADGKVLKTWEGFPSLSAREFTDDIKAIVDANK